MFLLSDGIEHIQTCHPVVGTGIAGDHGRGGGVAVIGGRGSGISYLENYPLFLFFKNFVHLCPRPVQGT